MCPSPGVFLEYAPIRRCYQHALDDTDCPENRPHWESLPRLLAAFPTAEAQALEYWLDASRFSHWRRPAVPVPLHPELLAADLACYACLGFGHVTTFACWLDADYRARWGEPPVAAYGAAFRAADGTGSRLPGE